MILCVDLDKTISADPDLFRRILREFMAAANKDEVHILTGQPHAEEELRQLGFERGREYTRVAIVPRKHIAAFKVAYMRQVGATHIIDNRGKNCRAACRAGMTALHFKSPKAPTS